jgi:hypothetical protein
MTIRTFQSGDDLALVSIYNTAAAALPGYKPSTVDEVRRRCSAADFDPSTRFLAVEKGRPLGYATFHANGRVSYPWCRQGCEHWAGPLFEAVLDAMRQRGHRRAFAAYPQAWSSIHEFFLGQGFQQTREMVNFLVDLMELPTPPGRPSPNIQPMLPEDIPAVWNLAPNLFRVGNLEELERALLHNPYFSANSALVLRSQATGTPLAAGLIVSSEEYADPNTVNPHMPCFWLGAFGTEGMQVKRINGLFTFVAEPGRSLNLLGMELLSYSVIKLYDTDIGTLAAQVPSDVEHLQRFYQQFFRRQGSFPVFEKDLFAVHR